MDDQEEGKRGVLAWFAIVPLSLLLLFCLTLPLSAVVASFKLFREGSAAGGAVALLLALPVSWPAWRCSRAIKNLWAGRESFKLTVSGRDAALAVFLLAVLSFLVWNAVNYTSAQRARAAVQGGR